MRAQELDQLRTRLEANPGLKIAIDRTWATFSSGYYRYKTTFIDLVVVPESPIYKIAEMDQQAKVLLPEGFLDCKYITPHSTTSFSYDYAQEYGTELPQFRIGDYNTAIHVMFYPDIKLAEVYKKAKGMSKDSRWVDTRSELQPLGWAVLHDRVAKRWRSGEDLAAYYLDTNTPGQIPSS